VELKLKPSRVVHTLELLKKIQPSLPNPKASNSSTQRKGGNNQLSSTPVKPGSQLTVTTIWLRLPQS